MFDIAQFRQFIITGPISELQLYSKDAEELMVFTCAVESEGGTLLAQINGPALGIFQCEPNTHNDLWRNFIFNQNNFVSILALNFGINAIPPASRLITDLKYASAICRLHYFRVKEKLPDYQDIDAIFAYYKKYYNTPLGKSTKEKSIKAYHRFCRKD
jgi:hypothetical protein